MKKNKTAITTLLVAVNVVVFLILEIIGDTEDGMFMLQHGAMNPQIVLYQHQYYRFFTSMFLHFGGVHMASNMLLLFLAGERLEEAVGPVKYFAIYIGSGLLGAFASFMKMLVFHQNHISAGASGAIFGIIGGLLVVIIVHRGRYENLRLSGIIIMIGLNLYYGFTTPGIDNMNHIGGFLGGIIFTVMLYAIPYHWKRRKKRSNRRG